MNLINAAQAYGGALIVTKGIFNVDPVAFLVGKDSSGYGRSDLAVSNQGGVMIGIGELLGTTGNAEGNWTVAKQNLEKNWMKMGIQTIGLGVGVTVAKKLLKKPRRELNRGFKMLGVGDLVKV